MHMLYFDQASAGIARRLRQGAGVILLGASVASCGLASGRAEAIQESSPSVTYRYIDDEGLVDATIKAEAYCRQFNAWPTTASLDQATDGDGNVTFVCDQTRSSTYTSSQTRSKPPYPTVNYTYRDDQALIDATSEAQRHCAGFGAYARSSTVTVGTDGTRTVVFECVRTE
jgi:hypothetical protein